LDKKELTLTNRLLSTHCIALAGQETNKSTSSAAP
jgi:hypothetical protein